jgi:DNA-binding LacI/PurR family transcriptional regulator
LPSQKELISRYGTSFRTLSAALQSLVADRVLSPQGRGHVAHAHGRMHGRPRVALLGLASAGGEFLMGDLDRLIMYSLESECARCGIDLDIIAFVPRPGAGLAFSNVQHALENMQLRDAPETLGYILLAIHPDSAPDQLLQRLRSFRKPVAVLDELGEYDLPRSFREDPGVRFFTMTASAMPGRIAARFCLAEGHDRAAYISPYHHYQFSRQRLRGLAETFRSAGADRAVTAHTHDELGMPELEVRSRRRVDTRALQDRYLDWRTGIPSLYARTIDRRIDEIAGLTLVQAEVATYCRDLFEAAARDTRVTVWILANDLIAGMALDFLNERNIRVPRTVSVLGFDNTFDALKRGISSYDFNAHAVADAMLQYIIRPRSLTAFRGRRVIEIEGSVVGRRTT